MSQTIAPPKIDEINPSAVVLGKCELRTWNWEKDGKKHAGSQNFIVPKYRTAEGDSPLYIELNNVISWTGIRTQSDSRNGWMSIAVKPDAGAILTEKIDNVFLNALYERRFELKLDRRGQPLSLDQFKMNFKGCLKQGDERDDGSGSYDPSIMVNVPMRMEKGQHTINASLVSDSMNQPYDWVKLARLPLSDVVLKIDKLAWGSNKQIKTHVSVARIVVRETAAPTFETSSMRKRKELCQEGAENTPPAAAPPVTAAPTAAAPVAPAAIPVATLTPKGKKDKLNESAVHTPKKQRVTA